MLESNEHAMMNKDKSGRRTGKQVKFIYTWVWLIARPGACECGLSRGQETHKLKRQETQVFQNKTENITCTDDWNVPFPSPFWLWIGLFPAQL